TDAYHNILGRDAGPSEVNAWTGAMLNGLTLEGLFRAFASSSEYIRQQQGVDFPFADDHPSLAQLAPINRFAAHPGGNTRAGGVSGEGTGHKGNSQLGAGGTPGYVTHGQGNFFASQQLPLANNTWVPIGPAPINGSQVPGRGPSTGRCAG